MSKLVTALRGGVRETAEVVIDANSMRIFSQEIQDCEHHINQSKQQLASIIAEKIRAKREVQEIEQKISQYEQRIATLLTENNEDEALKLAQYIADKEPLLNKQKDHCKQLASHEEKVQQTLKKMVSKLENYKTEYHMLKATDNLQRVQAKLINRSRGVVSQFGDMQDSLARIRGRQVQFSDQIEAVERVDSLLAGSEVNDLSHKLSAKNILDRVKTANQ